jgi:hypothetical protein
MGRWHSEHATNTTFCWCVDEIWQGARTISAIKRDMRYMLSGDEAGLDLYLPFDKYKLVWNRNFRGIKYLAATGVTTVKKKQWCCS